MKLRRLKVALFPELARFESARQQRFAWKVAELALMRQPWYWISGCGIMLVHTWVIFSLRSWGVPVSMRGWVRLTAGILVFLGCITLGWAFRKTIQRALRKQLVEDGIPTCIICGYDLRASQERCPECGTSLEKP